MKTTNLKAALSVATILQTSFVLAAAQAGAQEALTLRNMILLGGHSKPLFVDIFEPNYSEVQTTLKYMVNGRVSRMPPGSSETLPERRKAAIGLYRTYRGSLKGWKPARFLNLNAASDWCEINGKRLPTEQEWLNAAFSEGRNRSYTLAGDELYATGENSVRRLRANIRGNDTIHTRDFQRLGIDIGGTVGMTGNLPEWVIGAGGNPVQCGGSYATREDSEVEFARICEANPRKWSIRTATARCVMDYDPDQSYRSEYTRGVRDQLAEYLNPVKNVEEILIEEADWLELPARSKSRNRLR